MALFKDEIKTEIINWFTEVSKINCTTNQFKNVSKKDEWINLNPLSAKEEIERVYASGYGFKSIAKELNLSYTKVRGLFKLLNIETRKGLNVVTDQLRKIRSENVKGNKSPWYNWPELKPHLAESNSRGIQGYYKTKSGKYIWLRSTWEYIFIKWLETNNHEFIYEPESFKLLNGETYRPDLRVKSKGKFYYIEIKCKPYSDRLYKVDMFKQEYGENVIVIDNIDKFRSQTYAKEIKEWKAIRLSREKLKSLQ